mmetsp:Transcript_19939/g.29036  ORF Transcript_19939/g.29036 Transcript_19939/m.29036 type:complete len:91 (+) Transcript_19939:389-661(+)
MAIRQHIAGNTASTDEGGKIQNEKNLRSGRASPELVSRNSGGGWRTEFDERVVFWCHLTEPSGLERRPCPRGSGHTLALRCLVMSLCSGL